MFMLEEIKKNSTTEELFSFSNVSGLCSMFLLFAFYFPIHHLAKIIITI